MFKLIKNDLVDYFIGAAENTIKSHWSKPKFSFILLNISFLATPHITGVYPPLISAYVPKYNLSLPYGDLDFAQSAIFLLTPVVWAPIAVIFSSIFYQSLGTVIKTVLKIKIQITACKLEEI